MVPITERERIRASFSGVGPLHGDNEREVGDDLPTVLTYALLVGHDTTLRRDAGLVLFSQPENPVRLAAASDWPCPET